MTLATTMPAWCWFSVLGVAAFCAATMLALAVCAALRDRR